MICPMCGTPEEKPGAKCAKCGYDLNMFRRMNELPEVEEDAE